MVVSFDLTPLKPGDIPDPSSGEFQHFLDDHFAAGEKLIETMKKWNKHSQLFDSTVQILTLPSSSSYNETRKALNVKEFWCGRSSTHTTENVRPQPNARGKSNSNSLGPASIVRTLSERFSRKPVPEKDSVVLETSTEEPAEMNAVDRQAHVMATSPEGIYERFRRGLLEYHSENEREYIESCRETECLQIFQKNIAEVWRLTYVTPAPTNPRTFVILLLSREIRTEPAGERAFMNISLPFEHPSCPPKQGGEKSRVRARYVSVEEVRESHAGGRVEWNMATSSDAGGNIPRFITNTSLPSKIAEDVPSFIEWMVKRFPAGGNVASEKVKATAHD
ncbi:hypothetical protein P7C73_g651, partial [Tremellales sp. Uapishka_1]